MTTIAWDLAPGQTVEGFRLDTTNPDTGSGLFGTDLASDQTSIDTSLFNIARGTGYIVQVQAYVMDGATRVYSPLSNQIYVKEAVAYE